MLKRYVTAVSGGDIAILDTREQRRVVFTFDALDHREALATRDRLNDITRLRDYLDSLDGVVEIPITEVS